MSFSDGMKKIVQKVKNIHEISKMNKSVSQFQKMREAMKKVTPQKAGSK